MSGQLAFFISVAFGLVAWSVVGATYSWPYLRERSRVAALRPVLILHAFRFIGLSFLVPGVVDAELPLTFARSAALGDLAAAVLALAGCSFGQEKSAAEAAGVFNIWGTFDLVNAFVQAGASGLNPGQFGAAYFLPTAIVPLLLVTHVLVFRILLGGVGRVTGTERRLKPTA